MIDMITRAAQDASTITVHYEAGYIVLSYIVSLIGCITTLELLQRRTSSRGAFNWYLLTASSVTMGGVGIWCMHFIGNRAIVLANGADNYQLLYNGAYTALSFLLPIIVLFLAFYLLAVRSKATGTHILVAGILMGTAVCAMHYVGQVGIANYNCVYEVGNIVGAAAIAVVASLVALSIFFRLRDTWTDIWWKRVLCAALLAAAVSGMHWTATIGTEYRHRRHGPMKGSGTREQTVIVCAVLSIVACVFLLGTSLLARRRALRYRRRAQELVLACAYFDDDGQVMVTRDGTLPDEKITNHFVKKTFGDDELDRSHPAFVWVYQASRNWATLRDLISGMQKHLNSDPVARKYHPGHENSISLHLGRNTSVEFNTVFKQLFCVAAQRLAQRLHTQIDQLGVLFEEPLETGTCPADVDKGKQPQIFGKGRYLFLNRRLDKTEAADFAALGYRFGSVSHVADSLARNMQVNPKDMLIRMGRMKTYASKEHLHPAGVHLAFFGVRPRISAGFDVLVPVVNQNQLPLVTLPIAGITPLHQKVLNDFDDWTMRDITNNLDKEEVPIQQEQKFRRQLYGAILELADLISAPETMMHARFSARPIQAVSREGSADDIPPAPCQLLSVRFLGTITSSCTFKRLRFVPLDFFAAQQVIGTSGANSCDFKKRTELEFRHCLDQLSEDSHRLGSTPTASENTSDDRPSQSSEPPPRSHVATLYPDSTDSGAQEKTMQGVTEEIHADGISVPLSLLALRKPVPGAAHHVRPRGINSNIDLAETEEGYRNSFVSDLFALFQLQRSGDRARSATIQLV